MHLYSCVRAQLQNVVLTNVWPPQCSYLSGSKSLHAYFYHNLLQVFEVMGEEPHHLCLSRVHILALTCINHETLCIRHLVDLTLFPQHLCAIMMLFSCSCALSPRAFCMWKRFSFLFDCLFAGVKSICTHAHTHTDTHCY